MFRNLIFYGVVSVALVYLLMTNPAKVDEVCADAAAVAQEISQTVQKGTARLEDIGDTLPPSDAQSEPRSSEGYDEAVMTETQRSRRDRIMAGLFEEGEIAEFPEIDISDAGLSDERSGVRLEEIRERMEKIYLKNSIGL